MTKCNNSSQTVTIISHFKNSRIENMFQIPKYLELVPL